MRKMARDGHSIPQKALVSDRASALAFLWGCLALAAAVYLTLLAAGALFRGATAWRETGNPGERLRWAERGVEKVVVRGDSGFSSYYGGREDQTLWRQVEARLGAPVFPAVLDGGGPSDFVRSAQTVAASFPAGSTAFIDVLPSRFLWTNAPENLEGNWSDAFEYRLHRWGSRICVEEVERWMRYQLGRWL